MVLPLARAAAVSTGLRLQGSAHAASIARIAAVWVVRGGSDAGSSVAAWLGLGLGLGLGLANPNPNPNPNPSPHLVHADGAVVAPHRHVVGVRPRRAAPDPVVSLGDGGEAHALLGPQRGLLVGAAHANVLAV